MERGIQKLRGFGQLVVDNAALIFGSTTESVDVLVPLFGRYSRASGDGSPVPGEGFEQPGGLRRWETMC